MKPWIKHGITLFCAASLSACAGLPQLGGGGDSTQAQEEPKPVLPADYAAALELMKRERYAAAETALLNYAAANPGMSSPQVNLALLYQRTNRDEEAKAAIAKALQINPKQAAAYNLRGIYAREAGDFEAAKKAYEAAIDANPRYANAHLNLAILLDLYQHDPRKAMRHYRQYADLVGEDNMDQKVKSWIADTERRI